MTDLLADLKAVIRQADELAPRSQQKALGPSEVGHPCPRKLAFGLMREPKINAGGDPWPSIVGTAAHAWLADALRLANEQLGRIRWIPEQRVSMRLNLSGTCDVYDADTQTVIDWKLPGQAKMREYKSFGPSATYHGQVHLYGYGYVKLGFPVKDVALALLPRGGMLSGAHLWTEPYNEARALEIIAQMDAVSELCDAFDVEANPGNYQHIPIAPADCTYCDWFSPKPTGPTECDGGGNVSPRMSSPSAPNVREVTAAELLAG